MLLKTDCYTMEKPRMIGKIKGGKKPTDFQNLVTFENIIIVNSELSRNCIFL